MSEVRFSGGGRDVPLTVVRKHGARAMRLSVDPRSAAVRLSLPSRAALRRAIAWVEEKRPWIEAELARLPGPVPITPGMDFTVAGQRVTLDWSPDRPRAIRLVGDRLIAGGPRDGLGARVLRALRQLALATLDAETRALADANGIVISGVAVGDARGRWGSCSSRGDIRYSWRLILAPDHVRRATVAHEVAHRIHMDHGARFHALVAQLFEGDPRPARAWLKANGTALHWFGRDA